MRRHLAYRPCHYVMRAVEESKSRTLTGMITYHRRDLREKRCDDGWLVLPTPGRSSPTTRFGSAGAIS